MGSSLDIDKKEEDDEFWVMQLVLFLFTLFIYLRALMKN